MFFDSTFCGVMRYGVAWLQPARLSQADGTNVYAGFYGHWTAAQAEAMLLRELLRLANLFFKLWILGPHQRWCEMLRKNVLSRVVHAISGVIHNSKYNLYIK